MNTKFIVAIIALILGILSVLAVWFFATNPSQQPTDPTDSVTLPTSGATADGSITSSTTPTSTPGPGLMSVKIQGGGTVMTTDFIHNGVTLPDTSNQGQYLLAGDLGYCVMDPQACQAGATTDYNIYYNEVTGTFSIALLKEPLGEVRLAAEQFMMKSLGITQNELCKLNYYVGAPYDVNALYSSKNLGFSFCPGATVLPQ